jgi:hypothetical protein
MTWVGLSITYNNYLIVFLIPGQDGPATYSEGDSLNQLKGGSEIGVCCWTVR